MLQIEKMTAFCEIAQRGTAKLESIPAKFTGAGVALAKVSSDMANKLKQGSEVAFEEC